MDGGLTAKQKLVLPFVTDEPQTATVIYYKLSGAPNLTTKRRKELRLVAKTLESLAEAGLVERVPTTRHGVRLPAFVTPRLPSVRG